MDIIFTKTNKLKPINKIRKKLLSEEQISANSSYDENATHYVISCDNKSSCVSYIFEGKTILIYGFASENVDINDVVEYIKNNTKQFECEYKVI